MATQLTATRQRMPTDAFYNFFVSHLFGNEISTMLPVDEHISKKFRMDMNLLTFPSLNDFQVPFLHQALMPTEKFQLFIQQNSNLLFIFTFFPLDFIIVTAPVENFLAKAILPLQEVMSAIVPVVDGNKTSFQFFVGGHHFYNG
jgi:hypothetical protein